MWVLMGYAAAAVAALIVAFIGYLVKVDRARKAERAGFRVPDDIEHGFYFGIAKQYLRMCDEGKVYDWAAAMSKKARKEGCRPWAWSSPRVTCVVLVDPKDLKHCFHDNAENYTHADRKPRFQDILGDGIFNSDGPVWKEQRRIASHLFTKKQLLSMAPVFQRNSRHFCDILRQNPDAAGKGVDIQDMMYCYTFDSINEIAFGRKVDSLSQTNGRDTQFQKAFDDCQRASNKRFIDPFWTVKKALSIGLEREAKEALSIISEYLDNMIAEKLSSKDEMFSEINLLAMYVTQCEQDGIAYTPGQLRDVVLNNLIAGRDTTASVSTSMVYELLRHPAVLQRCEEEARSYDDVGAMEYLQAVFQETLRLHPSVPHDSRTCMAQDTLPSGAVVPKRAQVCFHPYQFTRNEQLYPDPDTFNPDRWMNADGTCKPYDQWHYPQFNTGPRICLGRHMAAMEAKTIIATLITEFTLTMVEGQAPVRAFLPVLSWRDGLYVRAVPKA